MRTHLWKYAALAAVCAAALAIPVAASHDSTPAPVAAASAEPPLGPGVGPDRPRGLGAGWPVVDRMVADADGDGVGDIVILRRTAGDSAVGPVRLEVQLSSTGANVWTVVRRHPVGFTLAGARDVDGDQRDELLLHLQPTTGDRVRFAAFTLQGSTLQRTRVGAGGV